MTEDMLNDLLVVIDARIEEKISDAFGRDGLVESVRFSELRKWFMLKWGTETK